MVVEVVAVVEDDVVVVIEDNVVVVVEEDDIVVMVEVVGDEIGRIVETRIFGKRIFLFNLSPDDGSLSNNEIKFLEIDVFLRTKDISLLPMY